MKVFNGIDELRAAAGTHVGESDWMTVDQSRVDTFADATEDHQWIHVDPERAKDGPFGGPIAHGFLTLSLLSHLLAQVYRIDGTTELWADPAFGYVQVFTPPDLVGRGRAVAVEPMTCPPDALNSGDGLITLAADASWSGSWGIRQLEGT